MNVKKSMLIAVLLACAMTTFAAEAKKGDRTAQAPAANITTTTPNPPECGPIDSPFPIPVPKPYTPPEGSWLRAFMRALGVSVQTPPAC